MIARQGQRGIVGPRGEQGPSGSPASQISGWVVDRASYTVTPTYLGGAQGPHLELRGLFQQFDEETNPTVMAK
jgi:hypothetical protein